MSNDKEVKQSQTSKKAGQPATAMFRDVVVSMIAGENRVDDGRSGHRLEGREKRERKSEGERGSRESGEGGSRLHVTFTRAS